MKKLLIILYLTSSILAFDKLIIATQASIYPKIILLDKEFHNKLINEEIIINIIYKSENKNEAIEYREFIKAKFGNNIKDIPLKIELIEYKEFNNSIKSSAIIALDTSKENFNKVVNYATTNSIILFSTNYTLFKNGALFFVNIEDKINIYLNKKLLREYKIEFKDVLYQITKEYSE